MAPPAPTKRKPEENPPAEIKKVKKDEEHKRPRITKARTLVRQMLEKISKPVDLSKLYGMEKLFNKVGKHSAFFDEEPHLSLWNRFSKWDSSLMHIKRLWIDLRKLYPTPESSLSLIHI